MPRLDQIMSGSPTFLGGAVETASALTVMAVDAVGPWGAAFELQIALTGSYEEQAVIAFHPTGCEWAELVQGGGHGDGWDTPWSPPVDGWDGRHLRVHGQTGTTGFSDDDEDIPLTAVYGFASGRVTSVRVEQRDEISRSIVPSPCGAWIVVLTGNASAELTPTADGETLLDGSYHVRGSG